MSRDRENDDVSSNELEFYLMEKIWNLKTNNMGCKCDFFKLVESDHHKYLVLARMAKDFLAILVRTVSSESTFNTRCRILDKYRSCLSFYMIEILILT